MKHDSDVIKENVVAKLPMECARFVNQKAHLSITSINQYYIKSASATMGPQGGRLVMAVTGYTFYSTMTIVARLCGPLLLKLPMAGLLSYILDHYGFKFS
jgi:hypothetical protein